MAHHKTELGQLAFKERSVLMSNRQRSLFLLMDGARSVDQILLLTKALSSSQADIDHLVSVGFIASGDVSAQAVASAKPPISPISPSPVVDMVSSVADVGEVVSNPRTPQERFAEAWPMATQLTAGMGLRGFMLNLAIEKASGYDELLALLPKIQETVGTAKCAALERALKA
jgi:hypothetical protein